MTKDKMSLYQELIVGDILTPIERQLKGGQLILHKDGTVTQPARIAFERPWLTAVPSPKKNCSKWLHIYFRLYQIIPKGCRNCWKIAFRPKTLEDAFNVFELQKELGIESKTGLETRGRTGNLGGYGSYWYTPLDGGLEMGREIFRKVESALYDRLGYTDGLILKRGCTELEHHFAGKIGDSTSWDRLAKVFDQKEKLLDSVFRIPDQRVDIFPDVAINKIKLSWIDWGFEHSKSTGDMSYLKYTGGVPHVPELFNYMEAKNLTVKIPISWGEEEDDDSRNDSRIETIV
jgi:hypothetical protein